MLPIGGHPFLEYLVWQLAGAGVGAIVMSCGYLPETIRDYFGDGTRWGARIRYSEEAQPLGTGGATRLAASLVTDDPFLVLNGDSVCEVDLHAVLEAANAPDLGALALARVPDAGRYGTVELDPQGRVTAFRQNDSAGRPALVNAGVYAFRHEALAPLPEDRPSSLETDLLPRLAGRLAGVVSAGYFVDMGLPETFAELGRDQTRLRAAVHWPPAFD